MMEFSRCMRDSRKLATNAYSWSKKMTPPTRQPLINAKQRDAITELAFFRVFSGWEAFLEETFILYLLGQQAPRGRKPQRYGFPPNEKAAHEWVAEGRDYAKWGHDEVKKRAERLFRDGHPFSPIIDSHYHRLSQVKTIRNAIAHESLKSRQKFELLVRNELTALPPNTTVGSFLLTTKPNTHPPVSFLEYYLTEMEQAAQKIVPI